MLYYPVPATVPVTIYSDGYLPQTGDVTNISARLDGPDSGSKRGEAMANACRNGDFTKFTNSSLAGGKGEGMRQILFVKYNRTRAAQFPVLKTEIVREDEVLTVEKTALTEAGEAHIRPSEKNREDP